MFWGFFLDGISQTTPTWVEMMEDGNANFYDIQLDFETYWENVHQQKVSQAVEDHNAGIISDDDYNKILNRKYRRPGWKQFKRWENYMAPRVYPTGDLSLPSKTWEFYAQSRNLPAGTFPPAMIPAPPAAPGGGGGGGGGGPSTMSASGNWQLLGPDSTDGIGRVNAIRFNPSNTNSIWICAPAGGLWNSTNGGTTWSTNTDFLSVIGCSDVLIDPVDTNIMYLATGDGDASDTYSIGVLKSTDAGASWNITGLNWTITATFRTIRKMIMDPNNSSIILVAASNGIYRTTNAGTSWTLVLSGQNVKDIEFNPGNSQTVFASTSASRFYRSTDNGQSFTNITSGVPSTAGRFAIAVTANDTGYVYILAEKGSTGAYEFNGLYRSTDGGVNFSTRSTTPNILGWYNGEAWDTGGQGWYDLVIAVSPTNRDEVFTGGVDIWRSTNGGTNWTLNAHWYGGYSKPYVHADHHALEFLPGSGTTIFSGCDGGVFKSTNNGTAWTDKSYTLAIAQMYRLGNSASNANLNLTGHQDNGTYLRNGSTFTEVFGGDGFESIIDWSNANNQYCEIYYGEIYKSTNGGTSFPTMIVNSGGAGVNANGLWDTPYIMNPKKNTTLIVGKASAYRSWNGGSSWTALGSVTGGATNITNMAYSRSDTSTIYVLKTNRVFKSTDNGTSFSNVSGTLSTGQNLSYIAVSSSDPQKAWVTYSGYGSTLKVFKTTDGGSTWTDYGTGLPNIPVNCIEYDTTSSNEGLYVGTDVGVYYRNNTLSSWQAFNTGLPNVIVSELEIHYGTSKIRAATYGRGLWESDLHTTLQAGFVGSPLTVCTNVPVTFTDTTSGTVATYAWTFGTGATPATASTVGPHSVSYSTTGSKTVQLIATGPEGTDTATYTNYVTVVTAGTPGGAGTWTWTGAASDDWFDACNWDVIKLPDALSDVIIPGSTATQPMISGGAAACKSITINTTLGGDVTIDNVGGGSLVVSSP